MNSNVPSVPLGRSGMSVSVIGYGSLPLAGDYGPIDDRQAVEVLRGVLDAGVNMIDTSIVYGDGHVEELVGQAVRDRRGDALLATKFGMTGPGLGRPDLVRPTLEASLRRLGTDYVDLYYLHQIDPTTPIEDTVGAMGELVDEGLIRAIGLSEVTTSTLRRAHETYPITAVQAEYSLLSREIEAELLPTVRDLGITLVAYSPFGRGLLSGGLRRPTDLPEGDRRASRYPRFAGRALARNLSAAQSLFRLADDLGTTPADLALGWVLSAHNVVPIPGTRRLEYFEANLETARRPQDADITRRLTRMFPVGAARGDRYAPEVQQRIDAAP